MLMSFVAALQMAAVVGNEPQAEALRHASERGALIYEFDQAGWVSTDALLKVAPNPAALGVNGWIVERKQGRDHVVYYTVEGGVPTAVFAADVDGTRVVSTHLFAQGDDRKLNSVEQRMIAARSISPSGIPKPCTPGPYNTVVIPPDAPDGPIDVYLLSAQTEESVFPLGGQYEFSVDVMGKVTKLRAFSKTCMTMSMPANVVAAVATDVLDESPNEIQVYLSLSMKRPYFVSMVATGQTWKVDGEQITLAKSGSADLPPQAQDGRKQ
ncbi:MAG TPA: hypothetical protein VGF71_13185 [Caulobacteraceae bacterium]|jgi:hypothetical protein